MQINLLFFQNPHWCTKISGAAIARPFPSGCGTVKVWLYQEGTAPPTILPWGVVMKELWTLSAAAHESIRCYAPLVGAGNAIFVPALICLQRFSYLVDCKEKLHECSLYVNALAPKISGKSSVNSQSYVAFHRTTLLRVEYNIIFKTARSISCCVEHDEFFHTRHLARKCYTNILHNSTRCA